MQDIFGGRPAEDILSRVVRITLGGTEYELAVLTIAGNKRWKRDLNERLAHLLDGLVAAPNTGAIMDLLSAQTEDLVALLIAYDTDSGRRPGVLPGPDEIEEAAFELELITAVREVWRAANPFAMAGIRQQQEAAERAAAAAPVSASSPPTSGRRRSTAGSRKSSKAN